MRYIYTGYSRENSMNANYLWGKGMDKKDWHTLTPGKEVVNTLPHSPQRAGQLVKA